MTLTFAGHLDHDAVARALDGLHTLVAAPEVADGWDRESALPGLTVGGLTRHLVSQPECAVGFLTADQPADAVPLSLMQYFDRVDWWRAGVEEPENTSIRDDFNQMAAPGPAESVGILAWARGELPNALAAAGPTTYVPWQDCSLLLDDFLVCRLLEIVVHADDLAVSIGHPTPAFEDEVRDPVLALLAALSVRRHGQESVLRALSRAERAGGAISAF